MADTPLATGGTWRPPLAIRLSAGLHGLAAGAVALHPAWWPGAAAAIAGNHTLLGIAGALPRSQWLGQTLHRLPDSSGIALTFDDGPDPEVTPPVLDLLAEAGARASFFCIGARARAHAALLRRIAAAGHGVENHTMTHPAAFACLPFGALRRQVMDAQDTIAGITGQRPRWFRAPMGIRSPLLDPILSRAGLQQAAWSRRGYDAWSGRADSVLRRLLRGLRGGDLLLLHDGNAARTPAGDAVVLQVLPALLAALHAHRLTAMPLPGAMPASPGATAPPAPAGHA